MKNTLQLQFTGKTVLLNRLLSLFILALMISFPVCDASAVSTQAANSETVVLDTGSGELEGTLLTPAVDGPVPVVLIIAGSGPTDRDGNQPMMMNNSLKYLAEELAQSGIASLRFDKRGIAKSSGAMISESELRFENYIDDTAGWITKLKDDPRFSSVVVAGHSEGSLIGMVAARQAGASGFISIAGAGRSLDRVIRTQLQNQPAFILDEALPILDKLVEGELVEEVSPILQALFRKSVQPYLISQFRYNPTEEISRLGIPVMIVQGTTDIQIDVDDAELLHEALPSSRLKIFEGMNHILKESPADFQQNVATYTNPELPLFPGLSDAIAGFISGIGA
jgi:uncharacterized protein